MARTLRDFKEFALSLSDSMNAEGFCRTSPGHLEFWLKLNRLQPEQRNVGSNVDLDAGIEIPEREWAELSRELQALEAGLSLG